MQKKYYIIAAVVLLVLAAGAFAYYKFYYLPQSMNTYSRNAEAAMESFNSGNYADASEKFKTLVAAAPNKSELGRLQLLLATSLSKSSVPEDRNNSVKILKQIVNDYSIPPVWRAVALTNIANILYANTINQGSFYNVYFPEEYYAKLVPSSGTEKQKYNTVYLELLKLSDDIYPTSFAEYSIAGNYYAPLYASNTKYFTESSSEIATIVQKYIAEGDSRNDESLYSPDVALKGYLYRALAVNMSGIILKNRTLSEREDAFKTVLSKADQFARGNISGSNPSLETTMRARFFYANFLMNNYSDRQDEIISLLSPFSTVDFTSPIGIFDNIKDMSDSEYMRAQSLKLAQISPEYKKFLQNIGAIK